MAFTEPGGESTNRLSVILNKTYKVYLNPSLIRVRGFNIVQNARQGNYNEALALLLDPSVWRGLSIHDYSSWAHQIWHILALRATRRFFELYYVSTRHYLMFIEDSFECTTNFSSLKGQPVHLTRKIIFLTLDGVVCRLSGSLCIR